MHYAELNGTIRRQLLDQFGKQWSIADVGMALDEAAKFIQGEIGVLKNRTSLSIVANQREYTVASTLQKPEAVFYLSNAPPHQLIGLNMYEFLNEARVPTATTIPRFYWFDESNQLLYLAPQPDTAAHTTTLTGAHSSTVTTLTVGSTTNFPTEGRALIESEVVSWTNKTSTTLTGVTRGIEGTVAASHANAVTVTERDLLIYGQRLYQEREMWRYYTTGTATFTNGSVAVSGASTSWLNNTTVGDYIGDVGASGANATTTLPVRWYKISAVTQANSISLDSDFLEPTVTARVYIATSPNPFPSYLDAVLRAYSMSILLKKGYPEQSRMEWLTVERFLNNARKNRHQSGVTLISGTRDDPRRRSGPMNLTAYGQPLF